MSDQPDVMLPESRLYSLIAGAFRRGAEVEREGHIKTTEMAYAESEHHAREIIREFTDQGLIRRLRTEAPGGEEETLDLSEVVRKTLDEDAADCLQQLSYALHDVETVREHKEWAMRVIGRLLNAGSVPPPGRSLTGGTMTPDTGRKRFGRLTMTDEDRGTGRTAKVGPRAITALGLILRMEEEGWRLIGDDITGFRFVQSLPSPKGFYDLKALDDLLEAGLVEEYTAGCYRPTEEGRDA